MKTLKLTTLALVLFSSICGTLAQTTSPSVDVGDAAFRLNPDKSNWFAYKNNDEGQLSQTQIASADNTVQGVYQYKHPETGPTRTEYTAGERGFRARGTDIARQMDLSQSKIPYNPPVDPNSPNYNPTYDGYHDPNEDPSYKFNIRTPTFVKDEVAGSQGQVQGSYTYTDDIGEVHRVDYEAGAGKGFRVRNPVPDNTQNGFYYGGPGIPPRGRTSVQQADDGSYTFVAQGPNLRRAEKRDNLGHVAGSYSYIDDKGAEKTVSYIAGPETGYQIVNKVPKEFIPLFQPGYFPSVTPVIPFPANFPKFPTSTFPPIKTKIPTTTFAPLFPTSTTTFRPPVINSFPSPPKPSPNFDDLFGSPQPTESPFLFSTTSSPSGGGYNNNKNNGNKNTNNYTPTTLFPSSGNGGDFGGSNKPDDFLNPQSNIFNPSGGYGGGGSQGQSPNIRPGNIPSGSGGNDFLTGPNINSVSNQIPVISFPVENPNKPPGDYSNICKVCRTFKNKNDGFYDSNPGYRPSYNSYNENNNGGDDFSGFPHGVAVRAHVQSIDLYPFGSRVPEPGEAIDSIERIDRSSPEIFDREVLYTTPSTNLISSLHNARANANSLNNEYSKIKSDRIVSSKVDYNEKNQKNKIGESEKIEASTYRGILGKEEFQDGANKNKASEPDFFKNFDIFSNQSNNFPSPTPQQNSPTDKNKNLIENLDTLFQNPQNNKPLSDQGLINTFQADNQNSNGPRSNYQNVNFNNANSAYTNVNQQGSHDENCDKDKHGNVIHKQKPKNQNAKLVGPNLLELLQKEVRSRPIYVPDLPEDSNNGGNNNNNFNSLSNPQTQSRSGSFETPQFNLESTSTTTNPESKNERNPPRGRKRGSSRYSRHSNKENVQQRRKERKSQ
ncbi:hypothetical protein M8J76_007638 [Diaphorina citri]|nr:hypothetical protein M8J76_007638 [Diaphorina citri]